MFVRDIQNLGLTEKEAKLYFTSLRLGPSSMQTLAAKARIDRGTAYHVAMTLEGKGLFKQTTEGGKRPMFGVTTPGELYGYVETRKREADEQFTTMQAMYADLQELYEASFAE